MRATTRFRRLVEADPILVMPGVYDALSARIAAEAGFQAITCGGYAATASRLGEPDTSQLTMIEFAEHYARLCDAVEIPVFGDMDTGFGNATNAARAQRAYERAGLAGAFIEDQVFPKRCGHMAGKAVVPAEEMLAKLRAVLDARVDPEYMVMARTDALAVEGLEAALERVQLYRACGADLLFVEAPRTVEQMRRICAEAGGPCMANALETGLSPQLAADELEAIGYALVALPVSALYAVTQTLRALYRDLRRDGTTAGWLGRMADFDGFAALVGLPEQRAREQAALDFAAELTRGHRRR